MEKSVEVVRGDVPGTDYRFTVLRFAGTTPDAPTAYLQAALHGNELPGVAALHYLIPRLAGAEREGRLLGSITVVPYANPIGSGQFLFSEHLGRFAFGSRTNFNRDFPLLDAGDASVLPHDDAPIAAEKRLKARLVRLALGHDLVLDLHCDDEGLSYLYIPKPLWPHMADLASCLGSEAVLVWEGSSDAAFEEALVHPWLGLPPGEANWPRRAVTTVEFRGRADVAPETAEADADGLYRFLVARGTISDHRMQPPAAWAGVAVPLDHVEMMHAPAAGALLYHVRPGDRVKAGDPLVTILTAPGEDGGSTVVHAPQDGLILTRRSHRMTTVGDDLLKLLGSSRSKTAKPGALEA
jgi:predicted deacylase